MEHKVNLSDALMRWADYTPDKVALTGSGQSWTYDELRRRVRRTARLLIGEWGLNRGDRVALLSENHPFFFELALACLKSGIILVPLNFRLSALELNGVLEVCRPRLLVHSPLYCETATRLHWPSDPGDPEPTLRETELLEMLPCEEVPDLPMASYSTMEEPAFLLFTSGTTGKPKAAMLPTRQLFWNAVNTALVFQLTSSDSTVLYTPLFHTGAINVLALPLLYCGGTVHVQEGFDTGRVVDTLVQQRVTTLFGVPITFQMLADQPGFLSEARRHLRLCLCGGAPLPVSLIHRYRDEGVTLTQGFGMTEVGPNCFFLPPDDALKRAGSVGKPMPFAHARIRVGGRTAHPGEVGELELSGPHVTLGYFRNPGETSKALDDGWFKTGDLASMDADGFYFIAGRSKDMFISGGENVYPAEVEVALMGHPSIQECAIVPVPDDRWGEVGFAFVVTADPSCTTASLRSWLRGRIAGYKVPRHVLLRHEVLPRNPSGKVVKADLSKEALRHVES